MRVAVTLACTECRNRNYTTTKNKKRQERLEFKKFCRFCKKHTIHKEVK
jgi:large subunit ribosomal protein L33